MDQPRRPISPNSRVLRLGRGVAVATASLGLAALAWSQYQAGVLSATPVGHHSMDGGAPGASGGPQEARLRQYAAERAAVQAARARGQAAPATTSATGPASSRDVRS